MTLQNTSERYGSLAQLFHWTTAAAFIGAYIFVYYAMWVFHGVENPSFVPTLNTHWCLGILIGALVIPRLLWKFLQVKPVEVQGTQLEHRLASSAHAVLYVILIVMPITGYLGTHHSTGFYLFTIPSFRDTADFGWISSSWHLSWEEFEKPLDAIHHFIGKRVAWLVVGLHVAAALFHHWIRRDSDHSDAEIDATFKQLRALGVRLFTTNQTRVPMGPKLVAFARKYGISPSWHPHARVQDPNEVATPEIMGKLLAMSSAFKINLDIGHYTAGNNDAVAFLRKHHKRITHLHVKDRKRDDGPNVQLGTGDTPIVECLRLIRDNSWPIYALLEREYRDPGTPVEEARWQMDYMKTALTS